MRTKLYFYTKAITLENYLGQNRISLNHSENHADEIILIDYYNAIISYDIFNYI